MTAGEIDRAAIDRLRPAGVPESATVGWWTYRRADESVAFAVLRWDWTDPDGMPRKEIRPAVPDGEGWTLGATSAPRPLYRLPELLADPGKPVAVVEGEKCADAAARVFPDRAAITWSGGSNAWSKTDWPPLAGRDVLLVADADDSGRKAMAGIAARLGGLGCKMRVHLPTGDEGDDIADWDAADSAAAVQERIEAVARPWMPDTSGPQGEGPDWKAELVEASKTDLGAPFERDTLTKLADLRRDQPAEWQRLRGRLKKLVQIVDLGKALGSAAEDGGGLQGRALEWDDPDPWPAPVDGAALLDDIAALIRRYASLPDGGAAAVALWIIHTWLHQHLELSTFLNITSATKRCGKSLLMEIISELVPRSLHVGGSITDAVLFRVIEAAQPTLLLDEVDSYLRDAPGLRGDLNASQRKASARTIRCIRGSTDSFEPRMLSTWAAKAFAGIGGMPDTVVDRCVVVRMERRAPGPALPSWRDRDKEEICELRMKLARWTGDNVGRVLAARSTVAFPPSLHDRARDAWESLLAIADMAGGEWAGKDGRAWPAAVAAAAAEDAGDSVREMLIADLRTVFSDAGDPDALPTDQILRSLNEMDGRPWPEGRNGKPLTGRGLASLLAPFKVRPGTIRLRGGGTPKGYKRASLEAVWTQYAAPTGDLSATTPQPAASQRFGESLSATSPDGVADRNMPKVPSSAGCGVVADTTPPSPGDGASAPRVSLEAVEFEHTAREADWDALDAAEERAAIMESDGSLPRAEAERGAERENGLDPGTLTRPSREDAP